MDKKTEFLEIFTERVTRDGAGALLAWLEQETDFFVSPASTKHHGAHPGGLAEHSLNVYRRLREITARDLTGRPVGCVFNMDAPLEETVAILALLHDICKAGVYHAETRRRKNPETGQWEDYQAYIFRDLFPLGHGEKSLFLISRYMDLTEAEALAIRWHMGAYDDAVKGGTSAMGAAMGVTPWVWRLQEADMCAAWIDEKEDKPT